MSDARWFEIEADMRAAVSHFERAVALSREGGFDAPDLEGYKAQMALVHSLQSGHTALESGLVRVLEMLGEERPAGENWHADLLRRVASALPDRRPAIFSLDLAAAADETRRFRHVAMHNYDNFRIDAAAPAVEAADRLARTLVAELEVFRAIIDPP